MSFDDNKFECPVFNKYFSKEFLQTASAAYTTQSVKHGTTQTKLQLKDVNLGGTGCGAEGLPAFPEFLAHCWHAVQPDYLKLMKQRLNDRRFADAITKRCDKDNTAKITDCLKKEDSIGSPDEWKQGLLDSDGKIGFTNPNYQTVLGAVNECGEVVAGYDNKACAVKESGSKLNVPSQYAGIHVVYFAPAEAGPKEKEPMTCSSSANNKTLSVVSHEAIKEVNNILTDKSNNPVAPIWGADLEDSQTLQPSLFWDSVSTIVRNLNYFYEKAGQSDEARPIVRLPGLETPDISHVANGNPIPLHLTALVRIFYEVLPNLLQNKDNNLVLYLPKFESTAEGDYIAKLFETIENFVMQNGQPGYEKHSIRAMVVFESPRSIFRMSEFIKKMGSYFMGATLGWHDFFASTARLFRWDSRYRIPTKLDPARVQDVIKKSHHLIAGVCNEHKVMTDEKELATIGRIGIGGMYGNISLSVEQAGSAQKALISEKAVLFGLIKDVITHLGRGLHGFWLGDTRYMRIAMALAAKFPYTSDKADSFLAFVKLLLGTESVNMMESLRDYLQDMLKEKSLADPKWFDEMSTSYDARQKNKDSMNMLQREILGAQILRAEVYDSFSGTTQRIRFNTIQFLLYVTDYLSKGRACVPLPTTLKVPTQTGALAGALAGSGVESTVDSMVTKSISTGNAVLGVPAMALDDCATVERSRWEIWSEIHHGRFPIDLFLEMVVQCTEDIGRESRNQNGNGTAAVTANDLETNWNAQGSFETWLNVAQRMLLKTTLEVNPREFVTELMFRFTVLKDMNAFPKTKAGAERVLEKILAPLEDYQSETLLGDAMHHVTSLSQRVPGDAKSGDAKFQDAKFQASTFWSIACAQDPVELPINCSQRLREWIIYYREIGTKNAKLAGRLSHKGSFKDVEEFLAFAESVLREDDLHEEQMPIVRKWVQNQLSMELKRAHSSPLVWVRINVAIQLLLKQFDGKVAGVSLATSEPAEKDAFVWDCKPNKSEVKGSELDSNEKLKLTSVPAGAYAAGRSGIPRLSGAKRNPYAVLKTDMRVEVASLTKTVGAAFAIDFFRKMKISMTHKVNDLLRKYDSEFVLTSDQSEEWAEGVELQHLVNHTALGMHYVYGFPTGKKPTCEALLLDGQKFGYDNIKVERKPGTKFKYSGGGFVLLEHMLELISGKSVETLMRAFLDDNGMKDFVLDDLPESKSNVFAMGFKPVSPEVFSPDGEILSENSLRLVFPSLTAGGQATTEAMHKFLIELTNSFWDVTDTCRESKTGCPLNSKNNRIAHTTAGNMLHAGMECGSLDFMGAGMGLGVFIADAGDNRVACHQAANDGYRGVYFQCFLGPDSGKGFTIVSLAQDEGVEFNARLAARLCEIQNWSGINFKTLREQYGAGNSVINHGNFSQVGEITSTMDNIMKGGKYKACEIVNAGLKVLFFDHLIPDLPDCLHLPDKTVHPIFTKSYCNGAKILKCSNQRFGRVVNILSDTIPMWDPMAFGKDGKIMDSWESSRHCVNSCAENLYQHSRSGEVPSGVYPEAPAFGSPDVGKDASAPEFADSSGYLSDSEVGPPSGAPGSFPQAVSGTSVWGSAAECAPGSSGGSKERSQLEVQSLLTGDFLTPMDAAVIEAQGPHDNFQFEMESKNLTKIDLISVSTLYHDGNHTPAFGIDFYDPTIEKWVEWVPFTHLEGHAEMWMQVTSNFKAVLMPENMLLRVKGFPDGGISRLGMYSKSDLISYLSSSVTPDEREVLQRRDCFGEKLQDFQQYLSAATSTAIRPFEFRYPFEIGNQQKEHGEEEDEIDNKNSLSPANKNCLTAHARSEAECAAVMKSLSSRLTIGNDILTNIASENMGAKIVYVSNQHYGPADWILKCETPLGMHDGFETKRSRKGAANYECVLIQLGNSSISTEGLNTCKPKMLEMDFSYFVNNNPFAMDILAYTPTNGSVPSVQDLVAGARALDDEDEKLAAKTKYNEVRDAREMDSGRPTYGSMIFAKHQEGLTKGIKDLIS